MRMVKAAVVFVFLLAGTGPGTVVADEPTRWLPLKRGTDMRLMVEDGGSIREVVGRLSGADDATVTVDTAGGPQRLQRDTLVHLRYRTGGRDRKKGAAIGASITGAAGLIAGIVFGVREAAKEGSGCDQCGIAVAFVGVAAGLGAAIPGGAIGFAIGAPGGSWRDVKPDGLTVGGAASPRRATVAMTWRPGQASN